MRLVKPGERVITRESPQARRHGSVPKSTWQYVSLACGHFTTSDVAALYAVFQVKPETYFCERCQEWTGTQEITALPAQDAVPPF